MRSNPKRLSWALVLAVVVMAGCHSAWVSSGLIYRDQGDYAKAEEMFKRAIDRSRGGEAVAFYELGNTLVYRVENDHLANGEIDSARIKMKLAHESYMKAAELEPQKYEFDPDADTEAEQRVVDTAIQSAYARMYNGGVQRMNSQRYDDAIVWFELAYLADPRGVSGFDALLLRNQLRYNQIAESGDTEGNEEALRNILAELQPLEVDDDWEDAAARKTDLVQAKARVMRALGMNDAANQLYEELLAESPDDIALIRQVASTRMNQQEFSDAGELYERAFQLARNDPEYDAEDRFELGYFAVNSYVRAEEYENVIRLFDGVREFATTNESRARVARAKARAHFELEEYEQAIGAIEPVVMDGGYDPNNLEAWQIYYLALGRAGRTDESMAARERFVALRDGTS